MENVTQVLSDPLALTPSQWGSRVAALQRHGHGPDDPAVRACREALAFWRCRRVIDVEVSQLSASGAAQLASELVAVAR